MKKIWKFPLEITGEQNVTMPQNARIMSVQAQNRQLFLWVLCEVENVKVKRKIYIYGTGYEVKNSLAKKFIDTVQAHKGQLVWHVFEESKLNKVRK